MSLVAGPADFQGDQRLGMGWTELLVCDSCRTDYKLNLSADDTAHL